jgi:hypothetical protein
MIVPFDADEVLNGSVEAMAVGLGGKQLDTACIHNDTWNYLRAHVQQFRTSTLTKTLVIYR